MRVVFHSFTYESGYFRECTCVYLIHRVKDSPLYRLESVDDMRNGTMEDNVGCVIQIPVLEHSGKLVLFSVAFQKFVELAFGFVVDDVLIDFLVDYVFFYDIFVVLAHILVFISESSKLSLVLPPIRCYFNKQL